MVPAATHAQGADDLLPRREAVQEALNIAKVGPYAIEDSDRPVPEAPGVQAARRYLATSPDGRIFGIILRAAVLGSDQEAQWWAGMVEQQFFRQGNVADEGREITERGGLDYLRWVRLIYFTDKSQEQLASSYVYILRRGAMVAIIEVASEATRREETGRVATDPFKGIEPDRSNALTALMDMYALRMGMLSATDLGDKLNAQNFAPFVEVWSRDGVQLKLEPGGRGAISWRMYRWCADDPKPPCDKLIGNDIQLGGTAVLNFSDVSGELAAGRVERTNDQSFLPTVDVALIRMPFDRLLFLDIENGKRILLCGPRFVETAPPEYDRLAPCGAN
jgi:hypothetical protein